MFHNRSIASTLPPGPQCLVCQGSGRRRKWIRLVWVVIVLAGLIVLQSIPKIIDPTNPISPLVFGFSLLAGFLGTIYFFWAVWKLIRGPCEDCGGTGRPRSAETPFLSHEDRLRLQPGKCRRCSYDLTGNVSNVCPECGLDVLEVSSSPDPP